MMNAYVYIVCMHALFRAAKFHNDKQWEFWGHAGEDEQPPTNATMHIRWAPASFIKHYFLGIK